MNGKQRIAIVDDDDSIRKSLRRLLAGIGFEVETFASGAEFLAAVTRSSPDFVVLDMHMPGLNGLELQSDLAGAGFRIPLLFITAHDDPGMRARALAGGAIGYLAKPVRKDLLLKALRTVPDTSEL